MKLVRLSPDEASRELADGRVVAVVTVPPGFVSTLRGMVRSPQLELQLSTGTISLAGRAAGAGARLLAQPPAPARVHRQQPPLHEADPARRRRQLPRRADHVLGIERPQRLLRAMPHDAADGAAARLPPRRAARAREHERRAQLDRAPDRARARARPRAHVGALGRGAGLRARADDHVPRAAARGRLARRRARRERRRAARARARRARRSSSGRRSRSRRWSRSRSASRSRSRSG